MSTNSTSNTNLDISDRYKPCSPSCWGNNSIGHLGESRYCLNYHCPYNKIYGRDDNEFKNLYSQHPLNIAIDVIECD